MHHGHALYSLIRHGYFSQLDHPIPGFLLRTYSLQEIQCAFPDRQDWFDIEQIGNVGLQLRHPPAHGQIFQSR